MSIKLFEKDSEIDLKAVDRILTMVSKAPSSNEGLKQMLDGKESSQFVIRPLKFNRDLEHWTRNSTGSSS